MSTTNYTTNSGENIHVKLQFNAEYRRFFVQRSCKFSELSEKIKFVLGLKDSNFIVKYKDEEGEWITISSDIELDTGLIISNGTLFRLQISLPGNEIKECETEKECETDGKEFDKPWRCKGKWKKWRNYEGEENEDSECRRFRGRGGRGGRCKGKWRKWRDERNNEENNEEEKKDEDNVTGEEGDKKTWKRFKRERKRFRKMDNDGESSSETNSGDALLSLEEIKTNLAKLKQDLGLLKEKSGAAKAELKDLRFKLKQKRRNEPTDIDGLVALRNTLKEKKQAWFTIFKEVKLTRTRIKKLHDLAETKTV